MISIENENIKIKDDSINEFSKCFNDLLNKKQLGFLDLHNRKELMQASVDRANELKAQVDTLCIVGIGGSSLGVELIENFFSDKNDVEIKVFDNVDPSSLKRKLETISNLKRTHWVIISKSGSTVETLTTSSFVRQYLSQQDIALSDHSTVVTELKDSALYSWAVENSVPILELPKDVGGRFSIFTPVGIFPACMMGVDPAKIFLGVKKAISSPENVLKFAAIMDSAHKSEKWISQMWCYSDRLYSLGLWWQQLWAESLAKKICIDGSHPKRVSTPMVCKGAVDQHSLLQQVVEGEKDKLAIFVKLESDKTLGEKLESSEFGLTDIEGQTLGHLLHAEYEGTMQALKQEGVPCMSIVINDNSEQALGELIMTFELLIGTFGEYLNINAFDQPGVESGKIITRNILARK